MSHDSREARDTTHEIRLSDVPDWHREPGSGLWGYGKKMEAVAIEHQPEFAVTTPEIDKARIYLERHQSATFFGGPLANVEHISLSEHGLEIGTSVTDFFTYMAAAHTYRDHQGDNPVRPLSAQAALFSPDGSRMIIERRPEMLADNPGKLSVFGSGLKPGADPSEAILEALNFKLHLNLTPDQIEPSGLVRDNVSNIYCVTYSVHLDNEQYAAGKVRATTANHSGSRMFYQINTDEARQSFEQMFDGKRPISEWDPNAYFNILYALGAEGKRTPEELESMAERMKAYMQEHPMEYTYPIEKYITPDQPV